MASPAQGMLTILKALNICTDGTVSSTNWKAFIGEMQSSPDECVTFRDTGGLSTNPRWLVEEPTVQVIIRSKANTYPSAYDKAKQVKDALLGINPVVVGSDRWDGVTMMSDIAFVGNDDNSRPLFTINFRIIVEPAASVLTNREPL